MSTPTREELLEELEEAFAAIDNGAIQAILFGEASRPTGTILGSHEYDLDVIQKLHKVAGPSIVKFVSENQEVWNHYETFTKLLRELKKCN